MKKLATQTITLALGISLFLGACENVPEVYKRGIPPLPKPEVSLTSSVSHQINFDAGRTTLSESEKAALEDFIYQTGVGYGDELYFDFAAGDPNLWEKKAALDDYLKTIGVWVDDVSQSGAVSSTSNVLFVVNRYRASSPDCLALSRESFVPTEMETNKIFGCITAHNLAAHVANPRDLVQGQPDSLPVADASVRAIQLYRGKFGTPLQPTSSLASLSVSSSGR